MTNSFFSGDSIDDIMRSLVAEIAAKGQSINPSRGTARELTGVLVELTNPRARISRTEMRGKLFSCLGELCWYLAGRDDLAMIRYYVPAYERDAEGGRISSAYGPRLFGRSRESQLFRATAILKRNAFSRKSVVQIFESNDLADADRQLVPCTCTMQFILREGRLEMLVSMRSNDLYFGFPHDVFCFTMLQEVVARDLGVGMGTYKHFAGSMHLYDIHADEAQKFLAEGWQSSKHPMPPMPLGDPWPDVWFFLRAESIIRLGCSPGSICLTEVDAYWADLIRLLLVYSSKKRGDARWVKSLSEQVSCPAYATFTQSVLDRMNS